VRGGSAQEPIVGAKRLDETLDLDAALWRVIS
jgi:hypothetical protein